jgi:hypothetical protein
MFLAAFTLWHLGRPVVLLVAILCYISLQELLGLVLFNLELLTVDSIIIFQGLKDFFILFVVVLLVTGNKQFAKILAFLRRRSLFSFVLCLYLLFPVISLLSGQGEAVFFAKIAAIRQFLMPLGLVLLGFLVLVTLKDLQTFLRAILLLNLFVVVIGLIEILILDRMTFYESIDMFDYKQLNMSEMKEDAMRDYLEIKFGEKNYVPMSRYVDGTYIPRFVSLYFEPLTAAYTLMIAAVISYSFNNDGQPKKLASWMTKSNITRGLLFSALLLSLTRGAILGFLVAVIIGRPKFISRSILVPVMTSILFLFVALIAVPEFVIDSLYGKDTSSVGHIDGILSGFAGLVEKPLGWGLGVGSYVGAFYSELDYTFSENLFLVYGTSLGAPYMIVAIVMMLCIAVFLHRLRFILENEPDKIVANAMFGLTIALVLISFTTEIWLGLRNTFVYWCLVGYLIRCSLSVQKNHVAEIVGVRNISVQNSLSKLK